MFVTIAHFIFPLDAHIARAKLESEGIPVFVADQHMVGGYWLYSNAIGGVKVQVPQAQAAQALEVLQRDDSVDLIAEQGDSQTQCPACGGFETEVVRTGQRLGYLTHILFVPITWLGWRVKCRTCGQ